MLKWLIVSSFQFVIFSSIRNYVYNNFPWWINGWCWQLAKRIFLKLWHCQVIWYLFAGLKIISFTPYDLLNMCFLLKYGSWKLQLESWNANHELLNRILQIFPNFAHTIKNARKQNFFYKKSTFSQRAYQCCYRFLSFYHPITAIVIHRAYVTQEFIKTSVSVSESFLLLFYCLCNFHVFL